MCTPCPLTRLLRWNVKDKALDFLAYGFPIEEPEKFCSPSRKVSTVKIFFDAIDEAKNNNASRGERSGRLIRCSTQGANTEASRNRNSDESSWSHYADEDYIVFCFREDGAFDVIKDARTESSNDVECIMTKSSRPINRKLNYGNGDQETIPKQSLEVELTDDRDSLSQGDSFIIFDEEDEAIYCDATSFSSRRLSSGQQVEEIEVSVESIGSNQSDNSTSSFAFPILGWEWTGSPVQMPKSGSLHLKKDKARIGSKSHNSRSSAERQITG